MDSGYHRELRTEELDLPSRILAVADVYDALTQNRPYREALSKDRALEILTRVQRTALSNVRGRARRTCRGGRPLERFSEGQSFENRRAVRLRASTFSESESRRDLRRGPALCKRLGGPMTRPRRSQRPSLQWDHPTVRGQNEGPVP